jgi:cysteine desulfurase
MKPIYLDYNATTPLAAEVLAAMQPYFTEHFGNPSSQSHGFGWTAQKAVEKSREKLAQALGAKPAEIFFTGGSTESNNWALLGLFEKIKADQPGQPIHILSSAVEHSSISACIKECARRGAEVEFLPVNAYGQVEIETIQKHLKPHTKIMSFIFANNEVGTLNPIREIGRLAKEKQIYFHTDATQAVGKVPIHVEDLGVDLLSLSGHKIYGPKGAGVLYIRSLNPKVQIHPLLFGGGQEKGLRSGTVNVPACVGLATACEWVVQNMPVEVPRLTFLRNLFWSELKNAVPELLLNGHPEQRICNTLNITLPEAVELELLLPRLAHVAVSTGSACASGSSAGSHVLRGIGRSGLQAQNSLRISLGRFTTESEVREAARLLIGAMTNSSSADISH